MRHVGAIFIRSIAGLLAAAALALPATASAATPFCASFGSGLCLSDHGNTSNGALIYTENRTVGPKQDITVTRNNAACGGTGAVQAHCPFNLDFMNNRFRGKPIETINMADTRGCIGEQTTGIANFGAVILNSCTATATNWVEDQPPPNGGRQFVNVWDTNQGSGLNAEYLDSEGIQGGRAQVESDLSKDPSNWAH